MIIGFIGLGIMGQPMCMNIVNKSSEKVMVYDIDSRKVDELTKLGAIKAESIEQIGNECDIIISMVPTSKHVKEVYEKLLLVIDEDKVLIDMSTIEPWISEELSKKVALKGSVMLDAPVVKSRAAAEKGDLGIYVGGDIKTYEKVKPILEYMGSNIIHLGKNGNGLTMKICHNMLVAQIQNGVNEMFILAQNAGIEIDDIASAISYGGGQNFYLDTKKDSIKSKDFSPKFTVKNMNKDIKIALELANKFGLKLNGTENVVNIYKNAVEENLEGEDFSATYKVIEKIARFQGE